MQASQHVELAGVLGGRSQNTFAVVLHLGVKLHIQREKLVNKMVMRPGAQTESVGRTAGSGGLAKGSATASSRKVSPASLASRRCDASRRRKCYGPRVQQTFFARWACTFD